MPKFNILLSESEAKLQSKKDELSCNIILGFLELGRAKLLTSSNKAALIKHAEYARNIGFSLARLNEKNLATQENFNSLVHYREFSESILKTLRERPLISQAAFDKIIKDINTDLKKSRVAFAMGQHPRLGKNSSLKLFFQSPICDTKYLPKMIFDFLPKPRSIL